ncbi:MAG: dehydrogenase [Gemmatimonadetes bacterium]|nr:dehydrogenase [Gemmatimonadota bacterium]
MMTRKWGPAWHRVLRVLKYASAAIAGVLAFGMVVSAIGYFKAPALGVGVAADSSVTVREVTGLYPVIVKDTVRPTSLQDIAIAVRNSPGPISVGGGRYSMGGQTATPDGLQVDMRSFHGVVALDTAARVATVRAGTTWRELQAAIDPYGLAVKIMQTYNTFTVGGALSVDAHGRYIGQGPLIRSVRHITLVLADGSIVGASRTEHPELFFSAIGGYGSVGVVAEVTLDLAVNTRVKRIDQKMPVSEYLAFFRKKVQADSGVIFHNADIYPPAFTRLRAASYVITADPVTEGGHLQPAEQRSALHQDVYALMSGSDAGKHLRELVIDPLRFRTNPVTWRNYEASYDVSELEPRSRATDTYVLQEYFVPVDSVGVFVPRMGQVFRKHHVDVVNVSIRHALPDSQSFLTWAPVESFAYVVYYRQGTDLASRRAVGTWTREMTDTILRSGGRWYLPYQPHATRSQFMAAYPRARELMAVKRRVDPTNKFTNVLWDVYGVDSLGIAPVITARRMPAVLQGEARMALDTVKGYYRDEASEFLTHPEWDLVYSSDAYAAWLTRGAPPSGFPYVQSVGTFWRSYMATWKGAPARAPVPFGTHVMLGVIGVSTGIEYGLKSIYENTLGRVTEVGAGQVVAEEQYAAKVARDYATLIVNKGWYEFSFASALRGLWRLPMSGPHTIRKLERRMALSGEYGIKAGYASLIGIGTAGAYVPDELTRYLVVAGAPAGAPGFAVSGQLDRGYTLLSVPRYTPYRDALLSLAAAHDSVRIAEIGGNSVVTFTGTAPLGWVAPARAQVVVAYADPASPGRMRVLLSVPVRDLLDVLFVVQRDRALVVDHIYDY